MPLQNRILLNKNRIAYLGALTLLFSYAEMLLPRFVPFFRLGLGNIAILLAFEMNFPSFLLLTIIKSITASMMAGTLFSPFFIISIVQSIFSGIVMYGVVKIKGKWISIYGVSMIGSAVSAIIQLLLSTIYLGKETLSLASPMLFFSVVAALITAFLSKSLKIPETSPTLSLSQNDADLQSQNSKKALFFVILIIIAVVSFFMIDNIWILIGGFIIALILQKISGRRILILPHLSIWIFVIFVSLLTPSGKVLWKYGNFSITQGAILLGVLKSLKLSIAAAFSQCAASLKPSSSTLIGLTLAYYRGLLDNFRNQEGKLIVRLQKTLSAVEL